MWDELAGLKIWERERFYQDACNFYKQDIFEQGKISFPENDVKHRTIIAEIVKRLQKDYKVDLKYDASTRENYYIIHK